MTLEKERLLDQARKRCGAIEPCSGKRSLEECFTEERGMLLFWFNSADGSTHMIYRRKE